MLIVTRTKKLLHLSSLFPAQLDAISPNEFNEDYSAHHCMYDEGERRRVRSTIGLKQSPNGGHFGTSIL